MIRKSVLFSLCFVLLAVPFTGYAQFPKGYLSSPSSPSPVPSNAVVASDAEQHLGKAVTICGEVGGTRILNMYHGGPTFIDLDFPYPNQTFTIVILEKGKELKFKFAKGLNNKKIICVTGRVQKHENKPQIVIAHPGKIETPCEVAARNHVILKSGDRCILDVYLARCHWKDICYVDCFSRGVARNLGGGCFHSCYAYSEEGGLTPPEGYADCLPEEHRERYLKYRKEFEDYE